MKAKSKKQKKIENTQTKGRIIAIIGFTMILINALSYLFHLTTSSPALAILGIIFLAIGVGSIRNGK